MIRKTLRTALDLATLPVRRVGYWLAAPVTVRDLNRCMAYIDAAVEVADGLGRKHGEPLAAFLTRYADGYAETKRDLIRVQAGWDSAGALLAETERQRDAAEGRLAALRSAVERVSFLLWSHGNSLHGDVDGGCPECVAADVLRAALRADSAPRLPVEGDHPADPAIQGWAAATDLVVKERDHLRETVQRRDEEIARLRADCERLERDRDEQKARHREVLTLRCTEMAAALDLPGTAWAWPGLLLRARQLVQDLADVQQIVTLKAADRSRSE